MAVYAFNEDVLDHAAKRGKPRGGVFYGIELEVELQKDCYYRVPTADKVVSLLGKDFVIAKNDGSLAWDGDGGFEIVTVPASLTVHKIRWARLLSKEPPKELTTSLRTGMHVHVSRGPQALEAIVRQAIFVNSPENRKFMTKIAGRDPVKACKYVPKKPEDIKPPAELRARVVFGYDKPRYEAINLTNDHTIEYRIFASTLDYSRLIANLEFAIAMTEWTAKTEVDLTPSAFTKFVESAPRYRGVAEVING